jgi:hypothetical protein
VEKAFEEGFFCLWQAFAHGGRAAGSPAVNALRLPGIPMGKSYHPDQWKKPSRKAFFVCGRLLRMVEGAQVLPR